MALHDKIKLLKMWVLPVLPVLIFVPVVTAGQADMFFGAWLRYYFGKCGCVFALKYSAIL